MEITDESLERFFGILLPHLNELQRRVAVGAMADVLGPGNNTRVATATQMSRNTIIKAVSEVRDGIEPTSRLRAIGGGDKPLIEKQPGLLLALDELVHPSTRGNPMSYLRWTSKSTRHLAAELQRQGFKVSADTVARILKSLGYSLQAPQKGKEGTNHPDRDRQFEYLNSQVASHAEDFQPVISVDTKKKELVGEFSNGGTEYHLAGEPTKVNVHDFVDQELGRAVPYGVYDVTNNEGWVSVGDSGDTASFAAQAIRLWWHQMGKQRFPDAKRLLVTADAGGSNGYRVRAYKVELAKLARELGLEITVCHYPPGTSKWNRIEHKMFSFISMNWRGRPLVSYRTIVELISGTTTSKGLQIKAMRDQGYYPTGVKISDAELSSLPIVRHEFHGEWNYTLKPEPIVQSN